MVDKKRPNDDDLVEAVKDLSANLGKYLALIAAGPSQSPTAILDAITEARDAILAGQLTIRQEMQTMSANIDRIEAATTKLAADVGNVQRAVDDLKGVVKDLQDQVAAGQLDQARLDAAAAKLEQVDSDLDAIAPDAPPPPPEA